MWLFTWLQSVFISVCVCVCVCVCVSFLNFSAAPGKSEPRLGEPQTGWELHKHKVWRSSESGDICLLQKSKEQLHYISIYHLSIYSTHYCLWSVDCFERNLPKGYSIWIKYRVKYSEIYCNSFYLKIFQNCIFSCDQSWISASLLQSSESHDLSEIYVKQLWLLNIFVETMIHWSRIL